MTDKTQTQATSSTEDSPRAPVKTYFDRDGDLTLEVGPYSIECVVCPRTLARASRVFKTMLYGGFKESKPSQGQWVVKLPEDDAKALIFVLHIIHGHYDKIPAKLSVEKLHSITVITDKYDLTSCLRPWASRWLEHLRTMTNISTQRASTLMEIAWELGDAVLFRKVSRGIILCKEWESLEEPIYESLENPRPMSHRLVKKVREEMFNALLAPMKQLYKNLLGIGSQTTCAAARSVNPHLGDEPSICRAVLLASFLKAWHDVAGITGPPTNWSELPYTCTLKEFYRQCKEVATSIETLQLQCDPNSYYHSDHSSCNPKEALLRQLSEAYNMELTLTENWHIAHLKAQAAKTRILDD